MRKITYENDVGDRISFFNNSKVVLSGLQGLGGLEVIDTKGSGYRQDGTSLSYSQLGERQITVDFYIKGNTRMDFLKQRDMVNKSFRPKIEGTIYYNDGYFDVMARCHPIVLPEIENNRVTKIGKGIVELLANDPVFYDRKPTLVEMTSWEGGFYLPGKLPFELKKRSAPIKNIFNSGHIETSIEVKFQGPAIKPMIRNLATGEFIRINQIIEGDETLIINTNYSNKTVEIEKNGKRTNAYNYIDLSSSFFYLAVGDNPMRYSSENINQINRVTVVYRNAYGGL